MKCMYVHNNIKILLIKNKTNNNKHVICHLYNIQLQKVKSNPQQPSCKKVCASKNAVLKKDMKSKVAAKKWL